MKTMLVPLDGSPRSETVLPVVVALASGGGYSVTLLSVWEVPPQEAADVGEGHVRELREQGIKPFWAYLGNVAETLAKRGIGANTEVRCGRPAAEILAAGGALKPDLVAMASKGRGGVTERVVRSSPVPVLVLGPCRLEVWPPSEERVNPNLALLKVSAVSEATLPVAMDMAREAGSSLPAVPECVLRDKIEELIDLAIAARPGCRWPGSRIGGRR